MDNIVNWLHTLKPNILGFLSKLRRPEHLGFYSYSLSGDIFDPRAARWGLGNTVFAAKIYYMLDAVKDVKDSREMADFIRSFQNESGEIYDPIIERQSRFRRVSHSLKSFDFNNIFNQQTRRAETRQAFAALMSLNEKPLMPYELIPETKEDIRRYILGLDWKRPWGASSHISHLIFFLKNNFKPKSQDVVDVLIDYALSVVEGFRQEDGAWYMPGGVISLEEKINGAMKIMLTYDTAKKDFSSPEKLIDLLLLSLNNRHACDNFNIVCVAYYCSMKTNYKKEQIESFCVERLNSYRQYYWPEYGGFSFSKGFANNVYYGATITKGLPEPDIHGTMLYLWGIVLISRILKLNNELNFRLPIT